MTKTSSPLTAVAISLVVVAGALSLAMPFSGDQSLFAVYARQLTHGAVLYRDVFDVKQPGVFVFYALGGSLFGFTEVGIHLFELLYWIAFSTFAMVALRSSFERSWASALVPVFTVVAYYFYADVLDLTQIEMLVAFPILLAWWLIDRADPETRKGLRRYAAAGLAAAAVVLFKHLYVLIVLGFLAVAALRSRRRGIPTRHILRSLGAFIVALLFPLLLVVVYFAAYGQLERIWWAYFQLAPSAQLTSGRPRGYFVVGARHFIIAHGPLLVLAVLGCVRAFRRRGQPERDLVAGMLLWITLGAVAFLNQGWAEYKWSLFTVPVGLIAVVGLEELVAMARSLGRGVRPLTVVAGILVAVLSLAMSGPFPRLQTRLLASVVVGVCAAIASEFLKSRLRWLILQLLVVTLGVSVGVATISPANKLRRLIDHDLALTVGARAGLRDSWNQAYRAADVDIARLRARSVLPGPFYVFGDPVILLRANRPQAVPILGWGPEMYDDRAWRELHRDLSAALPPYIIINGFSRSLILNRYPALLAFIQSRYKVVFVGASGTWYVRR